jgi:hypothetical protein
MSGGAERQCSPEPDAIPQVREARDRGVFVAVVTTPYVKGGATPAGESRSGVTTDPRTGEEVDSPLLPEDVATVAIGLGRTGSLCATAHPLHSNHIH